MLEQKTVQMGLDIFQQFGIIGGCFIIWVVTQSILAIKFKKEAVTPLTDIKERLGKCEASKEKIFKHIRDIELRQEAHLSAIDVKLEKRVTYEDLRNEFISELKSENEKMYRLINTFLEKQINISERLTSIESDIKNIISNCNKCGETK